MDIKCNKCKIDKPHLEFNKSSKSINGFGSWCKVCCKEYASKYYKNSKDVILDYKNRNKTKIKEYQKEYDEKYYAENKDIIVAKQCEYYQKNKEVLAPKQRIISKRNYDKDPEGRIAQHREYHKNNPGYYKSYFSKRYKTNIQYRLGYILRSRFNKALLNLEKNNSSLNLLGCSVDDLKYHIQSQFKPEMTWGNYGEIWEIDHIKPCSKFDLSIPEEQSICFHYTNLQPLFKTTKIAKSFNYLQEVGNRNKYNN